MMDKLSIALLGVLTDPAFLLDSDRRVQVANEKAKIRHTQSFSTLLGP